MFPDLEESDGHAVHKRYGHRLTAVLRCSECFQLIKAREVAVVGIPDERWGEKPVAIVVLAESAALELAALTDHCREKLAGFKIPKQLIIRDSLPRNPSGKVLKRVLRAELEATA